MWLVNHLLIGDRLGDHLPGNPRELKDNEENVRKLMKSFYRAAWNADAVLR